ncbi:PASTA domain-containing protein [Nonomuraea rubra]
MPNVIGKRYLEAVDMVEAAGLLSTLDDQTTTTDGMRCGRVKASTPGAGKSVTKGTTVTLVVVDSVCPEDASPTPTPTTPTPTVKKS